MSFADSHLEGLLVVRTGWHLADMDCRRALCSVAVWCASDTDRRGSSIPIISAHSVAAEGCQQVAVSLSRRSFTLMSEAPACLLFGLLKPSWCRMDAGWRYFVRAVLNPFPRTCRAIHQDAGRAQRTPSLLLAGGPQWFPWEPSDSVVRYAFIKRLHNSHVAKALA